MGEWPVAATAMSLAAAGHLSTAVVIADLRWGLVAKPSNQAGAASTQPHGPIHLKKGQISGYDRPVSWIYVFIAFR